MSAIRKRHRRSGNVKKRADDSLIEEKMREAVFLNLTVMSSEDLEKAKKSKQKDVSDRRLTGKRNQNKNQSNKIKKIKQR